MLKYNFIGTAARLWLPRGPNFGTVSVILDGKLQTNLSLHAADWQPSAVVWSWSAQDDVGFDPEDPQGLRHAHAVVLRWVGSSNNSSWLHGQQARGMVADSLDFRPFTAVPDSKTSVLDLAAPESVGLWLSHPALGEASFDSAVHSDSNPVYRGQPCHWSEKQTVTTFHLIFSDSQLT